MSSTMACARCMRLLSECQCRSEMDALRAEAAELRASLADAVGKIARMEGVVAAARVVAAEEKASLYVPRTSTYVLMVRVDEYEASLPGIVKASPGGGDAP